MYNFSGSSDYATDPVIVEPKSFLVPEHQLLVFCLLLFFPFLSFLLPHCLVCGQVIFFPVLLFSSLSSASETVAHLGLFFNPVCCKIKLPLYITRSMKCIEK